VISSILTACAFDPQNPNAPCNDMISPPLWLEILVGFAIVVVVFGVVVLLLRFFGFLRSRDR
jgi:hypothetical protein